MAQFFSTFAKILKIYQYGKVQNRFDKTIEPTFENLRKWAAHNKRFTCGATSWWRISSIIKN